MAKLFMYVVCNVIMLKESAGARYEEDGESAVDYVGPGSKCTKEAAYSDNQTFSFSSSRGGQECYSHSSARNPADAVEMWVYRVSRIKATIETESISLLPTGNFGDLEATSRAPPNVWIGAWKIKVWPDAISEYYYSFLNPSETPKKMRMEFRMTYATVGGHSVVTCTQVPDGMAKIGIWSSETMQSGQNQWSQCCSSDQSRCDGNVGACYKDTCMKKGPMSKPLKGPKGVYEAAHPGAQNQLQTCLGDAACWFAVPDDQKNVEVVARVAPQYFLGGDFSAFMDTLHGLEASAE